MTPSLKESAITFVRGLEWVDLFPVPREFAEALSWRGPELHLNSHGFSLFQKGGPGINLTGQSAEATCETVEELTGILAGRKTISLSLDKVLTLTSPIDIPFTSDRKTEQILDLRRGQEIPAKPSAYMKGWFNDPSLPTGASRQVVDVVVRRDVIDRILSQLRDAGTNCELVFARNGLATALPCAWNSDGLAYKQKEIKTWLKRTWLSLVCVGLAGVLCAAALLSQQGNSIVKIDEQLAVLQPEATRITKQIHAKDVLLLQVSQLVDRTSPTRLASAQLEELAALLPDDMVLTAFKYEAGSVVLEGYATAPEKIIELISKHGNFENVAFSAPVFRNPGEAKSRFVVSFSLTGVVN